MLAVERRDRAVVPPTAARRLRVGAQNIKAGKRSAALLRGRRPIALAQIAMARLKSVFSAAGANFSQLGGIAFARHGSANDPPGDDLNHGVAAVLQIQPVQGGGECFRYRVQILGAERAVCSQVLTYRHAASP
jgi:hypothetical protein